MTSRLSHSGVALLLVCCLCPPALAGPQSQPDRFAVDAAGQQVTVWSRQPEHPLGSVVLVHGRTWSARPDFDFEPRSGSRSLMKALATAGLASYAIDLPGYGSSQRDPSGWLAPGRAVDDVDLDLEPAADHPLGIGDAVLAVDREVPGKNVHNLMILRDLHPAGGVDFARQRL